MTASERIREARKEQEEDMPNAIANARYSVGYLESLPTLHQGQADDCKIDQDGIRIWLSRCTVEDGEPYNNKVTVERLIDGRWEEVETYPAQGDASTA